MATQEELIILMKKNHFLQPIFQHIFNVSLIAQHKHIILLQYFLNLISPKHQVSSTPHPVTSQLTVP